MKTTTTLATIMFPFFALGQQLSFDELVSLFQKQSLDLIHAELTQKGWKHQGEHDIFDSKMILWVPGLSEENDLSNEALKIYTAGSNVNFIMLDTYQQERYESILNSAIKAGFTLESIADEEGLSVEGYRKDNLLLTITEPFMSELFLSNTPPYAFSLSKEKDGLRKISYSGMTIEHHLLNGKIEGEEIVYSLETIRRRTHYKNGIKQGEEKTYHEDGTLDCVFNYSDGKKNGVATSFYLDGSKKSEIHYKDDLQHGEQRNYDENGKLVSIENYEEGQKEGVSTEFYPDGSVKVEAYFSDDLLEGVQKKYYENGVLESTIRFEKGKKNGVAVFYRFNGNKQNETTFKNDLKHGEYKEYDEGGKVTLGGFYAENKKEGVFETYYPDGIKKTQTHFKEDLQYGEHSEYAPNGKPTMVSNFLNGKKNGVETHYYPNGNIKIETHYVYDLKSGAENQYDQNGHLESVRYFASNELTGQTTYHSNGNKATETNFKEEISKVYFQSGNLKCIKRLSQDTVIETIYYSGGWACVEDSKGNETYRVNTLPLANKNKFEYIDEDAQIKEVRSLKNGVRHGKTVYYDLQTDKKIKEEKYDEGVLKMK